MDTIDGHAQDESRTPGQQDGGASKRPVPHVRYTDRLKDYMTRKGYDHIAMELLSPMGATADSTELYTRFIREPEAAKLRAKGWRTLPGEQGDILIGRGVEYDDEIEVGLRSFLGLKDITVKGIYAFRL
jgi:hypothetical protein